MHSVVILSTHPHFNSVLIVMKINFVFQIIYRTEHKKDLSGWGTVTLNDEDEEDGMPGKLIEL